MKAYTDISQSKKLAEILPLESADMQLFLEEDYCIVQIKEELQDWGGDCTIPCWSLAALMEILDRGALFKTPQGWACQTYIESKVVTSDHNSNPVDACYTVILKLKERNLL